MSDIEPVIKNVDMYEDMQEDALKWAAHATVKFTVESRVACFIKKQFDKKYGPTWQCIAGREFSSYVSHKEKHFMYFYFGDWAVLLFKTN